MTTTRLRLPVVLEPADTPGRLLLNGTEASEATRLTTGDAIAVLDVQIARRNPSYRGATPWSSPRDPNARSAASGFAGSRSRAGCRARSSGSATSRSAEAWPVRRWRSRSTRSLARPDAPGHPDFAPVPRPGNVFMVGYLTERYPDRADGRSSRHAHRQPLLGPSAGTAARRPGPAADHRGDRPHLAWSLALGVRTRLFRPPAAATTARWCRRLAGRGCGS